MLGLRLKNRYLTIIDKINIVIFIVIYNGINYFDSKFSFLQLFYEILSQTPKLNTFKESAHQNLQNF